MVKLVETALFLLELVILGGLYWLATTKHISTDTYFILIMLWMIWVRQRVK